MDLSELGDMMRPIELKECEQCKETDSSACESCDVMIRFKEVQKKREDELEEKRILNKTFPIQGESYRVKSKMVRAPITFIPWWLAEEAYKNYSYKDSHSLEKIAEKGGFVRQELLDLLRGK